VGHHGTAHPRTEDGGDSIQIWGVEATTLHKQEIIQIGGLTALHPKILFVAKQLKLLLMDEFFICIY
jgi:hypothetical protein